MGKERVVVTGLGVVSPLGFEHNQFYDALLEGKSGVKRIERFDTSSFPTQIAAEIVNFDPSDYLDKKLARRVDPCISYGVVAAKKAIEDAKLDLSSLDKERAGILMGSGMGGMGEFADGVKLLNEVGYRKISPFFVPFIITNMTGGLLAMQLGFMGPNYSISTACATSTNAIIAAADHIWKGEADLIIAGGTEAPLQPIGLAGFVACKALSRRNDDPAAASRPWDLQRDGFVMGEGGAALILESESHAKKRGATILAEYKGGGLSCDAHHYTEPRPDGKGVSLCVKKALKEAGLAPEDITYINCHATSTPAGDMAEIRALHEVFQKPEQIVINATKSMIGHSLGAAGALEAIVCVKAIERGEIHPTINLSDPEEGLRFSVPTKRMKIDVENALSNSFGFGGHNGSVIFGAYRD